MKKNPNNNIQTKTGKNSSSLKLVKIQFRNNLELVKVDPMKQDTYLKQTILLSYISNLGNFIFNLVWLSNRLINNTKKKQAL